MGSIMAETAEEIRLKHLEDDVTELRLEVKALVRFQSWILGGFGVVAAGFLNWLSKHGINFG